MSFFQLLLSPFLELASIISQFWWSSSTSQKKLVGCLGRLCLSLKECGGLGFRDLSLFNQSLFAKQAWSLLAVPNLLFTTIIKGKYYHSNDFLQAGLGSSPSHVGCGILWGRDLLLKGLRWRMGDGNSNLGCHVLILLRQSFLLFLIMS
ncbi:hypothetical protein ACOSQ3_019686 [Xanthoceras sorbifolium]